MQVKVALYTPSYPPDISGNATSTFRLVTELQVLGAEVDVYRSGETREPISSAWKGRVVHAFHAFRSGAPLLPDLRLHRPPLVITIAGTDLNHDLHSQTHASSVREVLGLADAVVVMHEAQRRKLVELLPGELKRVEVITPGVSLPRIDDELLRRAQALRRSWGVADDEVLFLLPAGVRSVKRPHFSLDPLAKLRAEGLPVAWVHVGHVLEPQADEVLSRALLGRPWARRGGSLPFEDMAAAYAAADVVLNTSVSEGLSNAVIEAMAAGRAVLVSDIEGNRASVQHGVTGLIADDATFLDAARRLVLEPELRRALGAEARRDVEKRFDARNEVALYYDLYRELLEVPRLMSQTHVRLTELTRCGG